MSGFGMYETMPRYSSSGFAPHDLYGNQGECIQELSRNMTIPQKKKEATPESAMERLGIYTSIKPRFPAYAVLRTRELSFQTCWSKPQKPEDLARGGFFYAGYGDFVRCFFCGGGLKDWEPNDDPWVEHAHWFPKCVFLLQNKGKTYVEKVQRMVEEQRIQAQETNESTATSEPTACSDHTCSGGLPTQVSEEPPSLIESIPALSVLEMGYSVEKVEQAIQIWSRDKNGAELRAVDLMDIIFKIEDESTRESDSEHSRDESQSENIRAQECNEVEMETEDPANDSITNEEDHLGDVKGGLDSQNDINSTHMMNQEITELQDENMRLKDLTTCKICMDDTVSVVFLPCGHLAACSQCAPALRKCPICRKFVKGKMVLEIGSDVIIELFSPFNSSSDRMYDPEDPARNFG